MALRLKKGDKVQVITGDSKGKTGLILKVNPEKSVALVEGINVVKRHTKPNQKNPQGGIVEKEALINLSNLMLVDPKTGEAVKTGVKVLEDGKKVRYSKKTGEIVD